MSELSLEELHGFSNSLYWFLNHNGATGFGLVRCRTGEGDLFSYIAGFPRPLGSTKPMFMQNWPGAIGYNSVVEPLCRDVYGFSLHGYVYQAFKGFDLAEVNQVWLMSFDQQIISHVQEGCDLLDKLGLDRLYLTSFDDADKLGDGFGYCVRKLVGKPCQVKRNFTGEVIYNAGLTSVLRGEEPKIVEGPWHKNHLSSLDRALKSAGVDPNVGYAGGSHETKAPFREYMRRSWEGASSLKQC